MHVICKNSIHILMRSAIESAAWQHTLRRRLDEFHARCLEQRSRFFPTNQSPRVPNSCVHASTKPGFVQGGTAAVHIHLCLAQALSTCDRTSDLASSNEQYNSPRSQPERCAAAGCRHRATQCRWSIVKEERFHNPIVLCQWRLQYTVPVAMTYKFTPLLNFSAFFPHPPANSLDA